MKNGHIRVKITADTTELERQMRRVTRILRGTTAAVRAYHDALERSLRRSRRVHRTRLRWFWRQWYRFANCRRGRGQKRPAERSEPSKIPVVDAPILERPEGEVPEVVEIRLPGVDEE